MAAENEQFIKLFEKNERRIEIEKRRIEIDSMERKAAGKTLKSWWLFVVSFKTIS